MELREGVVLAVPKHVAVTRTARPHIAAAFGRTASIARLRGASVHRGAFPRASITRTRSIYRRVAWNGGNLGIGSRAVARPGLLVLMIVELACRDERCDRDDHANKRRIAEP
jgi:hypothetical protein